MEQTMHLPGTGADLILRTDEPPGWCCCFISNRRPALDRRLSWRTTCSIICGMLSLIRKPTPQGR